MELDICPFKKVWVGVAQFQHVTVHLLRGSPKLPVRGKRLRAAPEEEVSQSFKRLICVDHPARSGRSLRQVYVSRSTT